MAPRKGRIYFPFAATGSKFAITYFGDNESHRLFPRDENIGVELLSQVNNVTGTWYLVKLSRIVICDNVTRKYALHNE